MIPEFNESICLNPSCTATKRIIVNYNQSSLVEISEHDKCQKWVLSLDEFKKNEEISHLEPKLVLNIKNNPVQSLLMAKKLRKWTIVMNQMFQTLFNGITDQIKSLWSSKLQQFELLQEYCDKGSTQISNLITQIKFNPQTSINQYLTQFYSFCSLSNYRIYDYHKLNQIYPKLLNDIKEAANVIQNTSAVDNIHQFRYQQQLAKTNQLFSIQSTSITDKLLQVSRAYKTQLIRAKFEQGIYRIPCWICKQQITVGQPPVPKQSSIMIDEELQNVNSASKPRQLCYKYLMNHIREKHYKEICRVYMNRVLRSQIYEIKLKDVVQEIKSKSEHRHCEIRVIWIVDRQNSGGFEIPEEDLDSSSENQSPNYWLDVVSIQNKHLAKAPYMIANSKIKDSADILIGLVVYELIRLTNAEVKLVTNDHFGIALAQIISDNYEGRFETLFRDKAYEHLLTNK